jgi:hypothetical protein
MHLVEDLIGSVVIWGGLLIVIATLLLFSPHVVYWLAPLVLTFVIFGPLGR